MSVHNTYNTDMIHIIMGDEQYQNPNNNTNTLIIAVAYSMATWEMNIIGV